ncbi:MAG TPA: hypothetical protein VNA19_16210 [Pyrinomonadaceae bacterium]|nr:hypothetical protein [Pyrinomonadaceae bacterium]
MSEMNNSAMNETKINLPNRTNLAACALLIVGLMQMTGDVFGVAWLKGLGAATCASPAPKVFSAVRGLETYSTRFTLEWDDDGGVRRSLPITSEVYSRLRGPYNRRNIYGAVLAYGPVLATDERTRPMFEAVSAYALCGDAPLLRELGIDAAGRDASGRVRVRYEPVGGASMGSLPRVLEVACR